MPVLPRELTPGDLYRAATETPESISGLRLEADALERFTTQTLDFSGCAFHNVSFNACEVDRIYFTDCLFEHCDLSGFRFRDGTMRRVGLQTCRLTGAEFDHMNLRDVTFEKCLLDYAGFMECKLQEVRLRDCRMEHGLLHTCTQKALAFTDCGMADIEIVGTRLRGVDLSTCRIDGIRATIQALEGATLGLHQAAAALQLCGIVVKM